MDYQVELSGVGPYNLVTFNIIANKGVNLIDVVWDTFTSEYPNLDSDDYQITSIRLAPGESVKQSCEACILGLGGQREHMEPGGCLYIPGEDSY